MRASLLVARSCLRQTTQQARHGQTQHGIRNFTFNSSSRQSYSSFLDHARPFLRRPPPPFKGGKALFWGTAALSPAAFIQLSDRKEEEDDDGKTGEQHMLEASRAELAEQTPLWVGNSKHVRRGIWQFLDSYIIEPIATGLRFLHLVFIFVPVIATIPMIWVGTRHEKRDGERWGTVWWYGFLVSSMERAGAAFIKVFLLLTFRQNCISYHHKTDICSIIAGSMGRLSHRHLPYRALQYHVLTTLQRPRSQSPRHQEDD